MTGLHGRRQELTERWALITDETDVLLTHGPPYGVGDLTAYGMRTGSRSLLDDTLKLKRLRLHSFGQIHEGAGAWWQGDTIIANVTHVGLEYLPRWPVRVFEL